MSTTLNRKLANAVVIINWILFAVGALVYFTFMGASLIYFDAVAKHVQKYLQDEMETKENEKPLTEEEALATARTLMTIVLILVGIIGLIALIIQLLLNILLMKGVNQSNRRKCNIWLIINLVFFVLGALGIIFKVFSVINGTTSIVSLLVDLVFLGWLGVSLFLIKNLRDDLGGPVAYGGVVYAKADTNAA